MQPDPVNVDGWEAALVGGICIDPTLCDQAASIVMSTDFADRDLGELFETIVDMRASGTPVDARTIVSATKSSSDRDGKRLFDRIGGTKGIAAILASVSHAGHSIYYAKQIRKMSHLRTLKQLGRTLFEQAEDPATDPEHLIKLVEAKSSIISGDTTEAVDMQQAMLDALDMIKPRSDGTKVSKAIPTGFVNLDNAIGGLYPGEYVVIGARTSVGKTAFATQIGSYNARNGRTVLQVSLEMKATDIAMRSLAASIGKSVRSLRDGRISKELWQQTYDDVKSSGPTNFMLWSTRKATMRKIRAMAKIQKASPRGLQLLTIDYFGLISPENTYRNRPDQAYREMSGEVQSLAMELDVPVVVLVQLSRGAEGSKPKVNDLRDSGAIEQDADVILLLHRESRDSEVADLIVGKARNGTTGEMQLKFDANTTTYSDTEF